MLSFIKNEKPFIYATFAILLPEAIIAVKAVLYNDVQGVINISLVKIRTDTYCSFYNLHIFTIYLNKYCIKEIYFCYNAKKLNNINQTIII